MQPGDLPHDLEQAVDRRLGTLGPHQYVLAEIARDQLAGVTQMQVDRRHVHIQPAQEVGTGRKAGILTTVRVVGTPDP